MSLFQNQNKRASSEERLKYTSTYSTETENSLWQYTVNALDGKNKEIRTDICDKLPHTCSSDWGMALSIATGAWYPGFFCPNKLVDESSSSSWGEKDTWESSQILPKWQDSSSSYATGKVEQSSSKILRNCDRIKKTENNLQLPLCIYALVWKLLTSSCSLAAMEVTYPAKRLSLPP